MGDIPKTSEYWAVQCDECDDWIALRPAGRIDDILTDPSVPFPEEFTVVGHEHNGPFHRTDVGPRILPHRLNKDLSKFIPVPRQQCI